MQCNPLHHTGAELAQALADQALGVFGSVHPTDDQRRALANALTAAAVCWINDEFDLGIPERGV